MAAVALLKESKYHNAWTAKDVVNGVSALSREVQYRLS